MNAFLLLSLFCAAAAQAALSINPIFTPHMVLQRGVPVPVNGTADGPQPVTVSFAGKEVTVQPQNGSWHAELPPMEACAEGRLLRVKQGGQSVVLGDVLVGEVWLAGGQSNMLWRLNRTGDHATLNAEDTPNAFRFFHCEPAVDPAGGRFSPELRARLQRGEMYTGTWTTDTPQSRARMSAVGYYFGARLQEHLGVPVGVIHCSVGGSEMLAWLPAEAPLEPAFKTKRWQDNPGLGPWVKGQVRENIGEDAGPHPYLPHYLFENGIRRWAGFPIAGVIWYQGEADSDIDNDRQNARMLHTLICSWRRFFKQPHLPFLMVQLPRINNAKWAFWPRYRQIQADAAHRHEGVECCVTIDLGSTNGNVHPPKKTEVGHRLAAMAAHCVYHKEGVAWSGPQVSRKAENGPILLTPKGHELAVSFGPHAEGLHTTNGLPPRCFEISADGKTFVPAKARIEGHKVVLQAEGVTTPRHVRYAWSTFVEPNLVNKDGLPAAPFNSAWKEPWHEPKRQGHGRNQ